MTRNTVIWFMLLSLFLPSLAYADNTEKTVDTLLGSASLREQRAAFEKIASSPQKYVPLVGNRLASIASGQAPASERSLDRLFYLAAFLKAKSLVPPIERLWMDKDFLPYYCEYSCPLDLSLTIYATVGLWKPPENINKVLNRHEDLYSEIRMASEISLEPTPQEDRVKGGIDKYLEEAAKESERQLIEQAGPQTQDFEKREAAAYQLEYSVSSSENLKDLYWLAIQEVKPDGANEFRLAIYMAIYRAEKARRIGR